MMFINGKEYSEIIINDPYGNFIAAISDKGVETGISPCKVIFVPKEENKSGT